MAAAVADDRPGGPGGAHAGAAEWAAWYEQYLTRAASQSARTLELYQSVLAAVSRGELSPTVLQDVLASFVQERGPAYTSELSQLSMRFFSGLVQLGTDTSRELVGAMLPDARPTSSTVPPVEEAPSWNEWYRRLLDYATQQGAAAAEAYRTVFERVASGDVEPSQLQSASSRHLEQKLPEHLQHLVGLCFELLRGLEDVRNRYTDEYLAGVMTTAKRPAASEPFALDLAAPLGGTASASLLVANTRAATSEVRCVATEIRRADGVGPAFAPDLAIAPERIELAPGEEARITITLAVRESHYQAGPTYVGALHVTGHGESGLDVPLRVRALPIGAGAQAGAASPGRR